MLRAATSKLIANDAMQLSLLIADNESGDSIDNALHLYAKADYMTSCMEYDKAVKTLDSIDMTDNPSLTDDVLMLRAQIAMRRQQYVEADRLLDQIVTGFPDEILGDDALFQRARLQEENMHDPLTAMDLYQHLLKNYPDSMHAPEARKRFRRLQQTSPAP